MCWFRPASSASHDRYEHGQHFEIEEVTANGTPSFASVLSVGFASAIPRCPFCTLCRHQDMMKFFVNRAYRKEIPSSSSIVSCTFVADPVSFWAALHWSGL